MILFRALRSVCSNSGVSASLIVNSSWRWITKAAIKDYQATRSGKTVGFELKRS